MTTQYWYEFAVPDPEQEYDPESATSERTNPENYNVVKKGVFYAAGQYDGSKKANEKVRQDEQCTLEHGVVMFTELENVKEGWQTVGFKDEDWRERLKRENPPADSVIHIDLEDL